MAISTPYVVEDLEGFDPDTLFLDGRDQILVGVRVTPTYGQLELALVAAIVDEANSRGFNLARFEPFREEFLLCMFEAYDDASDG